MTGCCTGHTKVVVFVHLGRRYLRAVSPERTGKRHTPTEFFDIVGLRKGYAGGVITEVWFLLLWRDWDLGRCSGITWFDSLSFSVGLSLWALWGLMVFHAMPDMKCSKEPLVGFAGVLFNSCEVNLRV